MESRKSWWLCIFSEWIITNDISSSVTQWCGDTWSVIGNTNFLGIKTFCNKIYKWPGSDPVPGDCAPGPISHRVICTTQLTIILCNVPQMVRNQHICNSVYLPCYYTQQSGKTCTHTTFGANNSTISKSIQKPIVNVTGLSADLLLRDAI